MVCITGGQVSIRITHSYIWILYNIQIWIYSPVSPIGIGLYKVDSASIDYRYPFFLFEIAEWFESISFQWSAERFKLNLTFIHLFEYIRMCTIRTNYQGVATLKVVAFIEHTKALFISSGFGNRKRFAFESMRCSDLKCKFLNLNQINL